MANEPMDFELIFRFHFGSTPVSLGAGWEKVARRAYLMHPHPKLPNWRDNYSWYVYGLGFVPNGRGSFL